jgi:hypothetical protein
MRLSTFCGLHRDTEQVRLVRLVRSVRLVRLVRSVRLVRLQTDNFRLQTDNFRFFLRQQTDNQKISVCMMNKR